MKNGSIYDDWPSETFSKIKSDTRKDVESNEIILSDLISQKKFYINELKSADKELDSLMEDLAKFVSKSKNREAELRNHIYNISEKIRIKDIDKIKTSMTDLHSQIIENISDIELLKREEITKKKTDIEERINLRILDSESRFKNILSKKLDEQDNILRSLSEYTKEMEKIKDNYDNIKKKSDKLSKDNKLYKKNISDIEVKNSKIKIDLTNLKKFFNYVCVKTQNNKTHDNSNLHSFNDAIKKSRAYRELDLKQNNTLNSKINTQHIKSDLTYVKTLLQNEKFVNENNRWCGTISSLANISDNLNIRFNKLKLELQSKTNRNLLQEKIIQLIQPFKIKALNKSLHILPKKNPYLDSILFKNEVDLNKDFRADFVNLLTNDHDIINMVHGEKIADSASFKKRLFMN